MQITHIHQQFKLQPQRAIALQCAYVADLVHDHLCSECQQHVDMFAPIALLLEHVDDYAKNFNEERYLFTLSGVLFKDEQYLDYVIQNLKQDTKENTIIELARFMAAEWADILSPQN